MPATVFHSHPGSRLYVTHGAAKKLSGRVAEKVGNLGKGVIDWVAKHKCNNGTDLHMLEPTEEIQLLETLLYDAALLAKKPVAKLTVEDVMLIPEAQAFPIFLKEKATFKEVVAYADLRLKQKVI